MKYFEKHARSSYFKNIKNLERNMHDPQSLMCFIEPVVIFLGKTIVLKLNNYYGKQFFLLINEYIQLHPKIQT